MKSDETFSRVRNVHKRCGTYHVNSKGGNFKARSGVQETGRSKPTKTRAEAEGQALRLGPRELLLLNRFRLFLLHLAGKIGIGEALACDLGNRQSEPLGIVHFLPGVVAERLFVDIAKQVVRFHADIACRAGRASRGSRSSPSCSCGRCHSRTQRRDR